jgi:anti-sigma factor RsiW
MCEVIETMNEHEQFEELCAVVAGGLGSVADLRELESHLQGCEECRDRFRDFSRIGAGILSAKTDPRHRPPAGMTARFVARAISEGIPLHRPARFLPTWASRQAFAWSGGLAAAILLAFLAGGNFQRIAGFVHRQNNEASVHSPVSAPTKSDLVPADRSASEDTIKGLQATLNAATADRQRLTQAVADLNDQINAKTAHDGELSAQIAALQNQLDQLKEQSAAKDAEIASVSDQLKRRETANSDAIASSAASQLEVHDLREQVAERDSTIQNQRQLLAAGSQARDLIIARNLHIIDVHDNNGEGERQRAFGRIFYTEGKQIVFYAYDLDSAARLKKQQVAFYVWGGRLGDEKAAKNLGIFHNEDAAAGRWVLRFDDPHVLAEINTVFVTAESKKNAQRPDGRQILFAFLGDKANHP